VQKEQQFCQAKRWQFNELTILCNPGDLRVQMLRLYAAMNYITWRFFKNVNRTKKIHWLPGRWRGRLAAGWSLGKQCRVTINYLTNMYREPARVVIAASVNKVYYACYFLSWVVLRAFYRLVGNRSSYWWLPVLKQESRSSRNLQGQLHSSERI
jgi:hypothetical protein